MSINARTKITGLIGYPVEHSLSPDMHNAAFEHLGLNYCYIAMPVKPEGLSDAVKGIRALNFHGCNVTVPHKQEVIPLLDEIDDEAGFIGAVNTIRNDSGLLKGFNTDGRGFMESLKEAGVDPLGKDIFIIGAGGAARAIGYYLAQRALRLYIFDVDSGKSLPLVRDLKKLNREVFAAEDRDSIRSSDIVINATPLGLKKDDPLPLQMDLLRREQVVCDLIYWDTPLIKGAGEKGCKTVNGLGMLLWQGVLAFQIWTGAVPPVDLMREILVKGMEGRE
ncbi:Shikimate 5-dehydrogenase I alpha [hydrothermal vent metagenome]|uniref:shikimate dehydrogenase (NADP(+)) n=1 Tax=hydrothermal vent metagenome TaxID=652676 RepID=A0A3B1CY55_9ZZZZ